MEPNQPLNDKAPLVMRHKGKCLVCSHPQNVEVTERYINEELSLREAGKILDCHHLTFQRHINQHVLPILERDPMIAPTLRPKVDKIRILEDLINKLYVRAQLLLDQDLDPKQEQAIKSIITTADGLIQTLSRLTKEIGNDVNVTTGSPELEMFRKATEEILVKENPEIWKKIRARMIEMASNRISLT